MDRKSPEVKRKLEELNKAVATRLGKLSKTEKFALSKIQAEFRRTLGQDWPESEELREEPETSTSVEARDEMSAKRVIEFFEKHPATGIDTYDSDTVEAMKMAKKDAKRLLRDPKLPGTLQSQLKGCIDEYHSMVEGNDFLRDLKRIGQEIKQMRKGEDTSVRYKELIIQEARGGEVDTSKDFLEGLQARDGVIRELRTAMGELRRIRELGTTRDEWNRKWGAIRKHIWDASRQARPFLEQKRAVEWIHGSKSAALPFMRRCGELNGARLALVPTGKLIDQHRLVPLSGEMGQGIVDRGGVNIEHLSGMEMANIDTCIGYASQESFQFDPDNEIASINELTGKMVEQFGLYTKLKSAVLRLTLTGQKTEEYKWLQDKIRSMKEDLAPKQQEKLEEIAKLFDEVTPIHFTEEEQKLIGTPFPIVWASTTVAPTPLKQGISGEQIVKGSQTLGEDIQLAFTSSENVELLSSLLEGYGVQVFSFEAGYAIKSSQEPEPEDEIAALNAMMRGF